MTFKFGRRTYEIMFYMDREFEREMKENG